MAIVMPTVPSMPTAASPDAVEAGEVEGEVDDDGDGEEGDGD